MARIMCLTIFLGIKEIRSNELNTIILRKISHLIPNEHSALVGCNGLRNSKPMNDLFLDELDHILLLCLFQGYCFVLISMPNSIPKRRNYSRLAL